MPSVDHLVINRLLLRSNMTSHAGVTAHGNIAEIAHAQLIFLRGSSRLPLSYSVSAEPTRGGPVATFAAHPIADIETLGAHLRRDRERMARETLRMFGGLRRQIKNFADADGNIIR